MVVFSLLLTYEGEHLPRKVAEGCSKSQLLDILDQHIMLAEVAHFQIVPFEYYVPFKEYTL